MNNLWGFKDWISDLAEKRSHRSQMIPKKCQNTTFSVQLQYIAGHSLIIHVKQSVRICVSYLKPTKAENFVVKNIFGANGNIE